MSLLPSPGLSQESKKFTAEDLEKAKERAIAAKNNDNSQTIVGEKGTLIGNNLPIKLQAEIERMLGSNNSLITGTENIVSRVRNILSAYQSFQPENIEARIQTLDAKTFLSTRITEDPFGQSMTGQDPEYEEETSGDEPKEKPPSLQDAIGTLIIRGVIPSRREFLSEGGQNVFEGDRIQLAFKGKSFQARVERVEEGRIVFRDRVSGDRAILPLKLGPRDDLFGTVGSSGTPFLQNMPPVNPVEGRDE